MKRKILTKQQIWKYLKENYAQLYFLGFGLFGFLIVILVAIEVLKGRAIIPDNLLGFIVLIMFAYFFCQFWANMASHITKERIGQESPGWNCLVIKKEIDNKFKKFLDQVDSNLFPTFKGKNKNDFNFN